MLDSPDEATTSCAGQTRNIITQLSDLLKKPKIPKLEEIFLEFYKQPVALASINLKYKYTKDFFNTRDFHSTVSIEGTLRCNLKESEQWLDQSIFVKVSPSNYIPMDIVLSLDLVQRYQKEVHAYRTIIPTLDKFQRDEAPGFDERDVYKNVFPICYGIRLSLNKAKLHFADKDGIIVLEHLKPRFTELDPSVGLDLNTTKLLVQKLALFHAVPLAFKIKHPEEYLEIVCPGLIVTTNPQIFCSVPSEAAYVVEKMKEIPELTPHEKIITDALNYSQIHMAVAPPEDTWICMCHGKYFVYNIMVYVKKEDNLVGDCRVLDLQHLMKRHVLTDLAFLLITCSSSNLLKDHFEEIVQEYHKVLTTVLGQFHIDLQPFNYVTFRRQLKLSFRKDLLRGLQQLKFMAAKQGQKEMMRSLSSWPKFREDELEARINMPLYLEKLKDCLLNLIHTGLLTDGD